MVRIEKVNGKNVWDLLKLKVSDEQRSFVAGNDTSIIEAYTAITGNGYAFPFGIYEEDTPVGFLMIGFDVDDCWDDATEIAKGTNSTFDNDYMDGETTYQYYNEMMWPERFADCISLDEAIEMMEK